MKNIKILAILLFVFTVKCNAQTEPFEIVIEPVNISGLGGLQAFAWGQHDGKWLIIGGRLDGLHRRQPFASFSKDGHNNQLIVVDPEAKQNWSASLSSLPEEMQEQLSSTNMEFYQEGDYLYLAGGYVAVPDPGAAAVNRQGHAPLAFPLRRAGTSEQGFAQFQHVRQQGLLVLAERSVAIAKQQQSGPWKAFLVAQCFAGEQVQLAAVLVQGSSDGIEGK